MPAPAPRALAALPQIIAALREQGMVVVELFAAVVALGWELPVEG